MVHVEPHEILQAELLLPVHLRLVRLHLVCLHLVHLHLVRLRLVRLHLGWALPHGRRKVLCRPHHHLAVDDGRVVLVVGIPDVRSRHLVDGNIILHESMSRLWVNWWEVYVFFLGCCLHSEGCHQLIKVD